nr:hypothetical protein [Tanacetum cinerariifolium]
MGGAHGRAFVIGGEILHSVSCEVDVELMSVICSDNHVLRFVVYHYN